MCKSLDRNGIVSEAMDKVFVLINKHCLDVYKKSIHDLTADDIQSHPELKVMQEILMLC
jgi:hypothetical protein